MKESYIAVDIGCGQQNNLAYYDGGEEPTVGLDINREFLTRRYKSSSGALVEGDAAKLPLRSQSVDQAFAIHSLEHVEDLDCTLNELSRVLKPGGKLTIAFPHERFESVMSKLDDDYCGPLMHRRVLPERQMVEELNRRGFEVSKSFKRGGLSALLISTRYLIHRKLLDDMEMEAHSGYLIPKTGANLVNLEEEKNTNVYKGFIKRLSFAVIFRILDRVYPFEVFMTARKKN